MPCELEDAADRSGRRHSLHQLGACSFCCAACCQVTGKGGGPPPSSLHCSSLQGVRTAARPFLQGSAGRPARHGGGLSLQPQREGSRSMGPIDLALPRASQQVRRSELNLLESAGRGRCARGGAKTQPLRGQHAGTGDDSARLRRDPSCPAAGSGSLGRSVSGTSRSQRRGPSSAGLASTPHTSAAPSLPPPGQVGRRHRRLHSAWPLPPMKAPDLWGTLWRHRLPKAPPGSPLPCQAGSGRPPSSTAAPSTRAAAQFAGRALANRRPPPRRGRAPAAWKSASVSASDHQRCRALARASSLRHAPALLLA